MIQRLVRAYYVWSMCLGEVVKATVNGKKMRNAIPISLLLYLSLDIANFFRHSVHNLVTFLICQLSKLSNWKGRNSPLQSSLQTFSSNAVGVRSQKVVNVTVNLTRYTTVSLPVRKLSCCSNSADIFRSSYRASRRR